MTKKDKKLSSKASNLSKSVEVVMPNSIELSTEDASVLRANEQNVLKAKLRLADIEITLSSFIKEKSDLCDFVKTEHDDFVSNARNFAVKYGINPDGDAYGDRWNLDTATMVFNKLAQ